MKQELVVEGFIFQELGSHREPVYVLDGVSKKPVTLEKYLIESATLVIPTVATKSNMGWNSRVKTKPDYVDDTGTSTFPLVSGKFVKDKMKKKRITITIEDV